QERQKKIPPPETRINIGGGLLLSKEEVNKIANEMVSPVLNEVSERADSQRAADIDIAERTQRYNQGMAQLEQLHRAKLMNNQKLRQATMMRHTNEKKTAQGKAMARFSELVKSMDTKVDEKNTKLAEAEKAFENLKIAMAKKLEDFEAHTKQEVTKWAENRELDLEAAVDEQKELIKPYQDDLKAAEEEHENLISERDGINENIANLREKIIEHKDKIINLEGEIVEKEGKQKEEETKVSKLVGNKDDLQGFVSDIVMLKAEKAKEEATLSSEQANLRQSEVDALVNERKSELNKVELELKREKLKLMEALGKSAEMKGEDKIDNEKLKKIISITPSTEKLLDEHVSKQMDSAHQISAAAAAAAVPVSSGDASVNVVPISASTTTPSSNSAALLGTDESSDAAVSASAKSVTEASGVIPMVATTASKSTASKITSPLSKEIHADNSATNEENEVKSTFSGFSQGTLPDGEEELESQTHELQAKDSYFKEVF
ncbi:hypothetical protein Kpol_197p3, partial [Vanderwaltozyma polyspora DSM 70294]